METNRAQLWVTNWEMLIKKAIENFRDAVNNDEEEKIYMVANGKVICLNDGIAFVGEDGTQIKIGEEIKIVTIRKHTLG